MSALEQYDLDAIMAEVFGPTEDELYAISRAEVEHVAQTIIGIRSNKPVDYKQWWLKRYTMAEIRWLGGTLEHL